MEIEKTKNFIFFDNFNTILTNYGNLYSHQIEEKQKIQLDNPCHLLIFDRFKNALVEYNIPILNEIIYLQTPIDCWFITLSDGSKKVIYNLLFDGLTWVEPKIDLEIKCIFILKLTKNGQDTFVAKPEMMKILFVTKQQVSILHKLEFAPPGLIIDNCLVGF